MILASVVMISCNKNSAKDVATKWLNDVYHADYDAAIPLSTELTKAELSQLSQLASYVNDSSKKDLKKLVINIKDVKEKGDTAIATYIVADNTKEQTLLLVKQNGKWLVAFTKEDNLNGTDFGGDQPAGADTTTPAETAPADTNMTDTAKNKD